ncbi:2,3-dihydroxyphenylpropionate/2,3-dihydroxicinnamic acid 1,2-dioxygenase [Candidatus Tiddalikarchaeum anstoanum]|nr:2,3-dihydroxyphenylpropionate/2,3-dihydroxicinnamic acid 1,2-dioxygenase [Candidatus Tiddalikarchaeum anstoanum]
MKTYRLERVSGTFYKSSAKELDNQIKNCFLNNEFGPKNEPLVKKTDEFMAFICPHAGYDMSGPCAAHAYRLVGENKTPDVVVIIGPNHNSIGIGAALFPEGVWATPIGEVEVDSEFNKLIEAEDKDFIEDELSHSLEHSIEVQVPFLKYVFGDSCPKIVPICINASTNDIKTIKELGDAIFKAWEKSGKNVLFIASSDFSHVGPSYGFTLSDEKGEELNKDIKVLDWKAVKEIQELHVDALFSYTDKENLTICGLNAIGVLMQVLKNMKAKKLKGKLLKQYTSGDVTGDYVNFVDYCAIQFSEEK